MQKMIKKKEYIMLTFFMAKCFFYFCYKMAINHGILGKNEKIVNIPKSDYEFLIYPKKNVIQKKDEVFNNLPFFDYKSKLIKFGEFCHCQETNTRWR
ncbi:MAG: hypothetical protein ACLFSQ_00640 [Candidatus Zixiibacteriota bacterium]